MEDIVAFWSSQTLEARLNQLVPETGTHAIDCNAITLTVGPEIYITPSVDHPLPSTHTKQLLTEKQPFAIPPGQFAFLLTEETVSVPASAMAFISMKATYKLRGLINVSGFHVDPGWNGRLIFSVFNAGPTPVPLERGLPLFLIWYADLDEVSSQRKTTPGPSSILPSVICNMNRAVDSLEVLNQRLRDETLTRVEEDRKLSDRMHDMERKQDRVLLWLGLAWLAPSLSSL
jgi:dCTP deaminase